MTENPKVFISYSHDSEEHKDWVQKLASDLMRNGIDTILDQWDIRLGSNIHTFMEHGLSNAGRVVAICTDVYLEKSNKSQGGVGYEKTILTEELMRDLATMKFIPAIRKVSGQSKTPNCLSGRAYIDFSNDESYEEKLDLLVHEIYGVPKKTKPDLGKSPFLPADETPILKTSSTNFFGERFRIAFPGVRDTEWFYDKDAATRLSILLRKPLQFKNIMPVWWFRDGNMHISDFSHDEMGISLMDIYELKIKKIAAVHPRAYYRCFVYVEVEPAQPSGVYTNLNINNMIKTHGYAWEETAIFRNKYICREDYDDGATVIGGVPVELDGSARLRIRYLSPYNFVICAQESPMGDRSLDDEREKILNSILTGNDTLDTLTNVMLKIPRTDHTPQ